MCGCVRLRVRVRVRVRECDPVCACRGGGTVQLSHLPLFSSLQGTWYFCVVNNTRVHSIHSLKYEYMNIYEAIVYTVPVGIKL